MDAFSNDLEVSLYLIFTASTGLFISIRHSARELKKRIDKDFNDYAEIYLILFLKIITSFFWVPIYFIILTIVYGVKLFLKIMDSYFFMKLTGVLIFFFRVLKPKILDEKKTKIIKVIISIGYALYLAIMAFFGSLMATGGIRHFKGDPWLNSWITSLGPGSWFAIPFILMGFFFIICPSVVLALILIGRTKFVDYSTNFEEYTTPEIILFLFIYLIFLTLVTFIIIQFDINSAKLFWSVV